jgi:TonB family protein
MTPDEVSATLRVEAAPSQVTLADGTRATVEDYVTSEGRVHVEYDGSVNRGDTRVALVWQTLPLSYDAVTALVKRLGEPASGKDALVRSLQPGPAVWVDAKCDEVVTYYRRPEYWIGDEVATLLRVERLSKISSGSPAGEAVAAWVAKGAPPQAPSPAPVPEEGAVAVAASATVSPDEMPARRTTYVAPVYPPRAKEQGVSGVVTLRIFVQKNGKVSLARVADVEPPGYGFENAAIEAAEQWRFNPALHKGRPVEGIVDFTVRFP